MGDFRSATRTEAFVGTLPGSATRSARSAPAVVRRPAAKDADRLMAMRVAELADAMSKFLGMANRPASGSTPEERRAQGQRVRAEFADVFGPRLKRTCRDLTRHRAMSEDEQRIIGLALEGSSFGLHAIACFLADRARQLADPSATVASGRR